MAGAPQGSFSDHFARQHARLGGTVRMEVLRPAPDPYMAIEKGTGDIALVPADDAYFLYRRSAGSPTGKAVRALATLQIVPLHLVARDGGAIRTVRELSGRPVGVTSPMTVLLARSLGLGETIAQSTGAPPLLEQNTLDAAFLLGSYPALTVETALRGGGRLLPIAGPAIDQLSAEYPFIRVVTIPAHTYTGQTEPVNTVGADVLYVCRADVSEAVAYELTRRLFDVLPTLAKSYSALRAMDATQAAATVIPLHPGAARYYREVELRP
jgi:uncharacterized protein